MVQDYCFETKCLEKNAKWEDRETLDAVRPAVRDILMRVPAFRELSPKEQANIARTMVHVASYMANPEGVVTEETPSGPSPVLARAQVEEDPVEATKRRLSGAPGQVGKGFEAGAVREGVEQFGELVKKVDFPKFVGGLIQNVFQAIVDSSIQQMRAYGELLANVAKTVDDFARDNISENNARDWLSQKFPDALGVEFNSTSDAFAEGETAPPQQTATLAPRGENPEQRLGEISKEVGLERPVTDISDPAEEQRLVYAARLQMASGMTAFAAEEILLTIQNAVQILQQPMIQRAFGARSLWPLVRTVAQRYLNIRPDTASYVTRGKSGLIILSWLADSLPLLSEGGQLLTLEHPVIGSAVEWLHASLTVREAQTGG